MTSVASITANSNNAGIEIDEEYVLLKDVTIKNLDLASFLSAAEGLDRINLLIELIETAMYVNRLANTTADVKELNTVALQVRETMESAGEKAFTDLEALIKKQSDDTNALSLISLLKTKLVNQVISELDPTLETSPFHSINKQLIQLLSIQGEEKGQKAAGANSPQHGRDLNKTMDGLLQKLAAQTGDQALYTNDITSETGSKVGDEVITIDSNFTHGHVAAVVWEFKAVKVVTQAAALAEISEAMENRHAQSGVFVLARTDHNANWAPFSMFHGRRAIIVVDEDNVDELLVQYAHIWSRVEAIRSFGIQQDGIDYDQLNVLIEEAKKAFNGLAQVTGAHTSIQTSLASAIRWLEESKGELKRKLTDITALINESKDVAE